MQAVGHYRKAVWQAGRQGGREAGRQGGREAGRQGGREAERQRGREAERQGGREAGRQKEHISLVLSIDLRYLTGLTFLTIIKVRLGYS